MSFSFENITTNNKMYQLTRQKTYEGSYIFRDKKKIVRLNKPNQSHYYTPMTLFQLYECYFLFSRCVEVSFPHNEIFV